MKDFVLISPQMARHRDGWLAGDGGRWWVRYTEEGGRSGQMEIERGFDSDTIYPETLRWTVPKDRDASKEEQELVSGRVMAALAFVSGKEILSSPGRA
jgi:hypothetical protein